jgi:Leucine-rich repeat (LRR) protein
METDFAKMKSSRPRHIALLLFGCLAFGSISLAGNDVSKMAAKQAQKVRVLEFPKDKSMGVLQAIDASDPLSEKWLNHKPYGDARGKIECAAGMRLGLRLNYDGANDLSPLLKLKSDDIVALDNKGIPIPAGQFQYLKNLTGLKRIGLDDSDISDSELLDLKGCRDLVFLSVTRTEIQGPGVSVLRNFPHLKTLFMGHNALDQKMLSSLGSLREVTELHLDQCGVGDIALISVGQMEALRILRLSDNKKITDAGIAHLKGLKNLQNLDIAGTSATKSCVKTLVELPKLRSLRISSSAVTNLDLVEIGKQLPKCHVSGDKKAKIPVEVFAPVH